MLVVVSLAALIAPQSWLQKLISVVQVLVPFQHAAQAGAEAVGDALATNAPSVSGADYDALLRSKQAAEHQLAALSVRVDELEREVGLLTAARLWNADGAGIGSAGRLIPARVLTDDVVPWRSSRLLTAGTVQGAERGAAVLSDYFTINRGDESGVTSGRAILLGESLIGIVARTGTHTSRVQLLSDPATEMKVRIGRFGDGTFHVAEGYFWLVGRGHGTMEIRDAKREDVDAGRVRVGDQVLSDPTSTILPAALVVGTIAEITNDPKKPLFATLVVETAVDPSKIERVYIFDPGDGAASQTE